MKAEVRLAGWVLEFNFDDVASSVFKQGAQLLQTKSRTTNIDGRPLENVSVFICMTIEFKFD